MAPGKTKPPEPEPESYPLPSEAPINTTYDVAVQSCKGDRFPLIMVDNIMYAVALPGQFDVQVAHDKPHQVMTATLEYAARKAGVRKNCLGKMPSQEQPNQHWETFRGFLVSSERSTEGQVRSQYKAFEFYEQRPSKATELVVRFFNLVPLPCTQKPDCPRCTFEAKDEDGPLSHSARGSPSQDSDTKLTLTPRNMHTRKAGVAVGVRRLQLATAKTLLEMGVLHPHSNATHAAWLAAYKQHRHQQAQMPPRAQAASIPSRTSVTVSGRPTTPDLYTPRQAASSGFYFSDNNLPLSRTGSEFDMELQNREKEQALKMMEEALEIMNRAMEERAVAVRVCHEMREERDAAVAAAAGLPPADARAAEGESPEALRAALHKQNELVRTLRSSLTLMAQDYTDVRCENERLRSDLGLAPVGELGSAL